MKTIAKLFSLVLFSVFMFSCSQDNVAPKGDNPINVAESSGQIPVDLPTQPCGQAQTAELRDANNVKYADVQILNDKNDVYFVVNMVNNWFISEMRLFAGPIVEIPKQGNGVNLEKFPFKIELNQSRNYWAFRLPRQGMGSCPNVCFWAEAVQIDFFGGQSNPTDIWMDGTPMLNTYVKEYCMAACNFHGQNNQQSTN